MNLVRALRVLIALEIGLYVLYVAADIFFESELPTPLQEYLSEKQNAPWSTTEYLQLAVSTLVFAALVAAWVGLWRLKSWARTLYSVATVLGILAIPISGPFITHGIAEMLSEGGIVISGMTLALIWFSQLATHFRTGPRNSTLNPDAPPGGGAPVS